MTEEEYLRNYDSKKYEKLSITADVLLFAMNKDQKLEVLLVKRTDHPYKDHYSIPGGFVKNDESIDQCAKRKMKEKTGISNIYMEQLYTFGEVERDPRMRIISVAYTALTSKKRINEPGENAEWFEVHLSNETDQLSFTNHDQIITQDQLAFDHAKMIKLAINRIRGKLDYTDIATKLLNDPNRFSVYELQKIYEAFEGKEMDTANFKRSFTRRYIVTEKVITTNELCREFSKKPSKYYQLVSQ